MANIVYRGSATPTVVNAAANKNAALTNDEIDKNFFALNAGPTIGSTTISPGTTSTTLAGLTSVTSTAFVGTLSTAAQPNITSVGTLTSLTTSGDIVVGGNFTVNGTTTTINAATLDVADLNITVAKNAGSAVAANGAGLTVAGAGATILYASGNDTWNFNKNIVGTLIGTASNVTTNANLSGDVTSVGNATTLVNTAVTAGLYGSSTSIPSITIDAKGRITAASGNAISVGNGALGLTIGAASASATSITIGTGSGFTANTAGAYTYDIKVGPALTNLVATMAIAGAGFIRRGAADTYSIDTSTYLTAESDTLATVTSRGSSTGTASTFSGGLNASGGLSATTGSFSSTISASNFSGSHSGTSSGTNSGDQTLPTTLPASDVYAWAKASTKPSYSQSEVGLGNVSNTNWVSITGRTSLDYNLAGRTNGSYACEAAGTNGPGAAYLNLIHQVGSGDVGFQIAGGYTSDAMYFRGSSGVQNGTGYTPWRTVIHSGNIGAQSVDYATRAGNAAANDVYAWAKASTKPAYAINEISSGALSATTGTFSSNVFINNTTPTIYMQDSDNRSCMLHCNGNMLYVLRGDGTNSTTWATYNGLWPVQVNLENNDFTSGGNVTAYSDARLKENVITIDSALDKTLKLRGVYYNRIGEIERHRIGVIAQEIREVLPEVVISNIDFDTKQDTLSVDYGNITALLIEAIKELNAKVDDLQKQLANK